MEAPGFLRVQGFFFFFFWGGGWGGGLGFSIQGSIWEFAKIRGTLFWGPYNKDLTISGTILRSPILRSPHLGVNYGNGVSWFRA